MSNSKIDLATIAPILVRGNKVGGIHLTADERDWLGMQKDGARTLCHRKLKPAKLFNESDTAFFHQTKGLCEDCDYYYSKLDNNTRQEIAA
jgi:hypothetical protein